ncbi:MAG: hypothetical protein ACREYC_12005, partial [Gammaproteobacteria bacterium]
HQRAYPRLGDIPDSVMCRHANVDPQRRPSKLLLLRATQTPNVLLSCPDESGQRLLDTALWHELRRSANNLPGSPPSWLSGDAVARRSTGL